MKEGGGYMANKGGSLVKRNEAWRKIYLEMNEDSVTKRQLGF